MDLDNLALVKQEGQVALRLGLGMYASEKSDEDFLRALHEMVYPEIGLLPPVIRWISKSKRHILLERPPTRQRVSFHAAKPINMGEGGVKEHVFELPIPWTLYAIQLGIDYWPTMVSVYALAHPIRSNDDLIGLMPLPNLYNSGAICPPPYNPEGARSIADGVNAAYRMAWDSGFNLDLNQAYNESRTRKQPVELFEKIEGRITPLRVYKEWEKRSLDELAGWTWPMPRGYGSGPAKLNGHCYRVGQLMKILQGLDQMQLGDVGHRALIMGLKQALAQA